jgi:L-serine dehydratase
LYKVHHSRVTGPVAQNDPTLGAVKAWIAFMVATNEIASRHRVDLDTTIKTLADTGRDMNSKYKETSEAGLAANLVLC